jgi:hypothetical protein
MRTPLSVATRGRITTVARNTLTIAVIGWLIAGGTPPIPPISPTGITGGGGSGGRCYQYENEERKKEKEKEKERIDKLLQEDELFRTILMAWLNNFS